LNGETYAEYSLYKENELCIKPKNISFETAATLPTSALFSYQSLIEIGKIKKGNKVILI
jgi:alcohol dehydrogenase